MTQTTNIFTTGVAVGFNMPLPKDWSILTELGTSMNYSPTNSAFSVTTLEGVSLTKTNNDAYSGYQYSLTVEATQETGGGGGTVFFMFGYGGTRFQYSSVYGVPGSGPNPNRP